MPEALAEWHQLDGSVRTHLKKLLAKRLDNPHVPGGQLHGPLAGCYKIKLLKQGVRLVYAVEDGELVVLVVACEGYAYLVPFVEQADHYFLKTVIPSRKATRDYLKQDDPHAQD